MATKFPTKHPRNGGNCSVFRFLEQEIENVKINPFICQKRQRKQARGEPFSGGKA